MRALITAALVILASTASAQMLTRHIGPGGFGGSAGAACGTGVIDLSAGCSLPIALGLVP